MTYLPTTNANVPNFTLPQKDSSDFSTYQSMWGMLCCAILYIHISVCLRARLVHCLYWRNNGEMCMCGSPWLFGHLSHTHRSIWQHAGRERFLLQNPVSLTTGPFGKPNLINLVLLQLRRSEEISVEAHLEKAKQQDRHIAHCVWTCRPYT